MGYKEIDFEAAVEGDLLEAGYLRGEAADFDASLALIPKDLFAFIAATQPELWAQLRKNHPTGLESGLLDALTKKLNDRGTLEVLRHGFKFYGKRIATAFFRPAHGLNPDLETKYAANRLVITRQVKFNPDGEDSVDMMVSLNGLPIATLELKNSLTGQTVQHALKQYQYDRDPKLPLFWFKKRALVHFAVDTDLVYMTTKLARKGTYFLPFNRGTEDGGAGNPTVEGEPYKTSYLWREVLERHSLLDILARFIHLEQKEEVVLGKTRRKEALIFPRYHQLDVVRKLEAAARDEGPGHHYLVQHSAGSGKSNSIAWAAHRLASLHDANDEKLFDSVVVVTDRRVLDRQLQDTIYQFEHKQGVVEKIDKHSTQLAKALERGTKIIITTLQKFPFVTEKIENLPDRRYAIIVDEAHSSQTGEAARTLRAVLAGSTEGQADHVADAGASYVPAGPAEDAQDPDEPTYEDEIARVMKSRGKQPNLSFFAFTATPKAKTLEVFGRKDAEGKPRPFHLYSMRQAIEEGFILDVLRNYVTYRAYYKLMRASEEFDPEVKKKETARALARFASLHPHNIAQKIEVIVEHYRRFVRKKIGGKAKAMVVTRSRLHAVRYKLAFDEYLAAQGYDDTRALVAFSGTVIDPDSSKEFTEVGMNDGLPESEVPTKFGSDEFQVLLVANKFQTGFDQPLLCAMYVDKRLSGVQCVQTLSRLNRKIQGKENGDTFVLDFVNEAEEIRRAFQPFYEQTTVSDTADPYQLEQLQGELDDARIWTESELESFAKVFYRPKQNLTDKEHAELHHHLQPAVDRFAAWEDEEARDLWKGKLQAFVRLYSFMSQVMPWDDRDLEIRYSFGRFLLKRLPRTKGEGVDVEGEVDLHSYRLTRLGETDIVLDKEGQGEVKGPTSVGTGKAEDEDVPLHEVIDILNERFGTDFTKADQLLFEQIIEDGKADEQVQARAKANTLENFSISIKDKVEGLMIDRMDKNQDIVTKFLNEEDFKKALSELLAKRLYDEIRDAG
ncbi:MAG: type I restriction endonuclease subunit R [Sandaracinus sp.]|nr:type I restriction endonuclease subunit R [Sandaracinus sp.]|tara:strand:+ start:4529 stop:7561 length:3033 start_codon:yes stop_codon:yes gene_type:complete